MRRFVFGLAAIIIVAGVMSPGTVKATDGYFMLGTGVKSQGMGGAGVAFPLGQLSSATNPASLPASGPGFEAAVSLFNPNRSYDVTGSPSGMPGTFGLAPGKVKSSTSLFVMPSLGFSKSLGSAWSIGLALWGNGGMNTDYHAATFGVNPTGINMSQMFAAPTVAAKVGSHHAFGVSAVLAYQMFKAEGLQAFGMFSSDASKLTNNGTSSAFGAGVRVGYLGQWSKTFSLGASYQSRVSMGAYKKYTGLFAEQGGFDIPSTWTVGIGVKPTGKIELAADVQRINYSEVKSIANPMLPNLMQSALGMAGGAGFGWRDMTVVKAGVQVQAGRGWVLRGGYAYGRQPVPASEVMFNILAPGVIEHHATAGFSKDLGRRGAIDVAIVRAFNKTVTGPNPLEVPGRQQIQLGMNQWIFTVGYSMRAK